MSESQKGNTVLIIVAIIGVIGTIGASIIGVMGMIMIEKQRQEFALTQVSWVAIATQGEATQRSMESTISAPTRAPIGIKPVPTVGSSNPVGIVQADKPIYVDGFALSFGEISASNQQANAIDIRLIIKNVGDRKRIFRYAGVSITLRDDVGNTYPSVVYGNGLYDTEQTNIDVGQSINLYSGFDFPAFTGPMAQQAKSVFIGFKDFGPFTGFEIEVKP